MVGTRKSRPICFTNVFSSLYLEYRLSHNKHHTPPSPHHYNSITDYNRSCHDNRSSHNYGGGFNNRNYYTYNNRSSYNNRGCYNYWGCYNYNCLINNNNLGLSSPFFLKNNIAPQDPEINILHFPNLF